MALRKKVTAFLKLVQKPKARAGYRTQHLLPKVGFIPSENTKFPTPVVGDPVRSGKLGNLRPSGSIPLCANFFASLIF